MSARLVASLAIICTLATGCTFSLFAPSGEHVNYDDHAGEDVMLLVGITSVAFVAVAGLIAIARNTGSHEEAPRIAPPPPKEVVFAPTPANAATEGDQLRLQRMYAQGQLLARVGRCDGVMTIGRVIYQNDPAYYAQFAAEPSIAGCLHP